MATLNGRDISLDALAGLSDEAIKRGLANGTIEATDQELGEINEKRREEGRSAIFNIVNKSAADLGIIGREGTSDIQRAASLGLLLTAFVPGGGIARGGAAVLRAGGALRRAALSAPLRAGAGAVGFALRRPKTTAAIVGGGVLGGAVVSSALGGDAQAPSVLPEGVVPEEGTAVDAQLGDLDAALAEAQASGGFSGDISGLGEVKITRLVDAEGNDLGGFLIQTPDGGFQTIFDDELPSAVAARSQEELKREDLLRTEARTFALEDAASARGERELDRQLRERELQGQFFADLPGLIETFATPQGQLLSEAFFGRQSGALDIAGGQVGPVIRGLFGLGAEDRIPLPGATQETTIEDITPSGQVIEKVTTEADPLGLTRVPTQNFLANLTGQQTDLLDALFQIGGIDPRDFQRQQQRLAAPGSGRGVSAAVSRR